MGSKGNIFIQFIVNLHTSINRKNISAIFSKPIAIYNSINKPTKKYNSSKSTKFKIIWLHLWHGSMVACHFDWSIGCLKNP